MPQEWSPDPNSPQAQSDCFKPPAVPTLVHCIHCHNEYDSYQIEWRIDVDQAGRTHGFWCCPMPGCGGKGFGFDIFPVDPEYRDEDGHKMWTSDEDGDDDLPPGAIGEPSFEPEPEEPPDPDDDFDPAVIEAEVMKDFETKKFDAEKLLAEILDQVDESKLDEDEDDPDDDADEDKMPF